MRNLGYLTVGGKKNLSLLAWQLSMLRRHCSQIADIEKDFFVCVLAKKQMADVINIWIWTSSSGYKEYMSAICEVWPHTRVLQRKK